MRWEWIETSAKLIYHGRQWILKLTHNQSDLIRWWRDFRMRIIVILSTSPLFIHHFWFYLAMTPLQDFYSLNTSFYPTCPIESILEHNNMSFLNFYHSFFF